MLQKMGNPVRHTDRLLIAYSKLVIDGAVFGCKCGIGLLKAFLRQDEHFEAVIQHFAV
ncbi:hypothetical protein D3C84_1193730 [compost metagenome]